MDMVEEELVVPLEDVVDDQYRNYEIEMNEGKLRSCMICGKFEYCGGIEMDKMFKCSECRQDFEKFEEDLNYETISDKVDKILEMNLWADEEIKAVNYYDARDIAMRVLKEIK